MLLMDQRYDALEIVEEEKEEEELQRYGLDFDEDLTTLTQVDNVAVPEGYLLGVGDELLLTIIGS